VVTVSVAVTTQADGFPHGCPVTEYDDDDVDSPLIGPTGVEDPFDPPPGALEEEYVGWEPDPPPGALEEEYGGGELDPLPGAPEEEFGGCELDPPPGEPEEECGG